MKRSHTGAWLMATGAVFLLAGLAMAALGAWLAILGGSWYYLLAGIVLAVDSVLVLRGDGRASWLYALLFVGTGVWALSEVGLDGWQLLPRLVMPALLGVWLSLPPVSRRLTGRTYGWRDGAVACAYLAVVPLVFGAGYRISAQRFVHYAPVRASAEAAGPAPGVADGDWRYYGRSANGRRFSPLARITPRNVGGLQPAWTFRTGDLPREGETKHGREFNFEATPIKVGDTLYFCTPHRWVFALDAVTGKQKWKFDPQGETGANEYLACRGVAYYEAPAGSACPRRIISTAADARLFALDADTGKPCEGFGEHGFVSLTNGMGEVPPGFHFITSQPMVMNGRIVLGGWVYDNQAIGEPSGVVRAYDADTGALAWAWDMGKPDPTAPLKPGETYTRGTPNGWGTYTADPELGLVYVPLGIATPDYWGGKRRPFDETYDSAVVALDIATGKERWHYQTVHHDVWDFDLPVGPTLIDLPGPHGPVPALIQPTKTGQFFVLDRRTGRPLTQVVEKPVPGGPLPGDRLSPTQPFSVGMPALTPADLKESDMWGATPLDQLWCRIEFRKYRYDGIFTPPNVGGTISYPAFDGVVDWHGVSVDPTRMLLIANASYIPFTFKPVPTQEAIDKGWMKPWKGWGSGQPYPKPKEFAVGPQHGTPFAARVAPWLGPLETPCHAPTWGKLVAIDLVSHKIAWERPLGTTRDTGPLFTHYDLPLPTGVFNIGGSMVTASGLIFIGATADQYLRAFDSASGDMLWRARLPAGGQANPMSYLGADGRQYVVISAGGHGGLRTRSGDYVMAYALPR